MNSNESFNVEIDVLMLLKRIWYKKFLILFVSLLLAVAAFFASTFLLSKEYTSTTRIYVVSRTNDNITNQDLQAGSYLVNDYKEIITSADVMNQVIEKDNLSITAGELSSKVSVSIPADTRVISISVEDSNPNESARLADDIREAATEKIKEVTKVEDVTTLEAAKVPTEPSSPNTKRNTILGFLAGAFLMTMIVVMAEVLDDRVKTGEDVENKLGMALLGVVPNINKM
ncbi:Wzz/FepE/Etk N-terminal domain-containing protein [Streptococcus sp. zg-JUN1979]|uniref:Wzz/FepE/Etk N-terminal domain-containing protein n=1 Tax=Streptococcus sp. zg-JUN1979 TaxID=3391450 RepID=UPI0039A65D91